MATWECEMEYGNGNVNQSVQEYMNVRWKMDIMDRCDCKRNMGV